MIAEASRIVMHYTEEPLVQPAGVVTAFCDASVRPKFKGSIVQCAVVFIDDGQVRVVVRDLPRTISGVGISRSSFYAESYATIVAIVEAPEDKPLVIWSDCIGVVKHSGGDKAGAQVMNGMYRHLVEARTQRVELRYLPKCEHDQGFHKWAHAAAAGLIFNRIRRVPAKPELQP